MWTHGVPYQIETNGLGQQKAVCVQYERSLQREENTQRNGEHALRQTRSARKPEVGRLGRARREQEQKQARRERRDRQRRLSAPDGPARALSLGVIDDEARDGGPGDAEDGDDDVVAVRAVQRGRQREAFFEVENEEAVEERVGEADDPAVPVIV